MDSKEKRKDGDVFLTIGGGKKLGLALIFTGLSILNFVLSWEELDAVLKIKSGFGNRVVWEIEPSLVHLSICRGFIVEYFLVISAIISFMALRKKGFNNLKPCKSKDSGIIFVSVIGFFVMLGILGIIGIVSFSIKGVIIGSVFGLAISIFLVVILGISEELKVREETEKTSGESQEEQSQEEQSSEESQEEQSQEEQSSEESATD